ncbi:MAG: hypothetical protein RL071_1132, partial [Pseudomonadota bacterium]
MPSTPCSSVVLPLLSRRGSVLRGHGARIS